MTLVSPKVYCDFFIAQIFTRFRRRLQGLVMIINGGLNELYAKVRFED